MSEPVEVVELTHLEAMGIGMSLCKEEQEDGLSQPQRDALEKVQEAIAKHMQRLGRPS